MDKYVNWTLEMLKAELRERRAKISGRKHELIERLEAYDRNFNFKDPSLMTVESGNYNMQLPDLKLYKDINQSTTIPLIDEKGVNAYLAQFAKTPDRVIDDDHIVEVKCPFSAKHRTTSAISIPFLQDIDGELTLDKKHNYYYQVQGQLICTGRQIFMFFVYTQVDIKCICISQDADFIVAMVSHLEQFYSRHLKRTCLDKFFYKRYNTFTFDRS